ncbi:MAG: type IV pilus twitching motility protein PilT [Dehalococcoidales bacterium]|nr:type IV pilus twitching motility protein PilT [Dehalococcoidales bacterium]
MDSTKGIHEILRKAVDRDTSDIHIKAGSPPLFRVHRELISEECYTELTKEEIAAFFNEITTGEQKKYFEKNLELDFSYNISDIGRFRVNAYLQTGNIAMVFRWVRRVVPAIEQLGLPDICRDLSGKKEGLVIITGPTGCGKSTTLAAMLNDMNHRIKRNIITIEDPIEFIHMDEKCTFSQREVGVDTRSFADALKHVFRQDPDIILIGEMRDIETMAIALTAAETGHLVLTTLHTPSSYEAIDRIIDAFPPEHHNQVRLQLSATIKGILFQDLVPCADREAVVPAVEILIATPAIRNLIREGKTHQILNFISSGQENGMKTMDQALAELYHSGKISRKEALSRMRSPEMHDETERQHVIKKTAY